VEIFSFDDKRKNTGLDFNLPLLKKLTIKFGDKELVEAALYAMMLIHDYEFTSPQEQNSIWKKWK